MESREQPTWTYRIPEDDDSERRDRRSGYPRNPVMQRPSEMRDMETRQRRELPEQGAKEMTGAAMGGAGCQATRRAREGAWFEIKENYVLADQTRVFGARCRLLDTSRRRRKESRQGEAESEGTFERVRVMLPSFQKFM